MPQNEEHILVAGGAGYIGSVLVPMLASLGKRVTVLDTFQKASLSQFDSLPLVESRIGDIRNEALIEDCLNRATAVIYLAGISDGRAGKADPELTKAVNTIAFEKFAQQAQESGCRRLLFASTFGVYGYNYKVPLTEDLPADPQEPYSESKLAAEQILAGLNNPHFTTVSLRLAMVYGYAPNMRLDFLVNQLIYNAISTGQLDILGGDQIRPQIHIEDVGRYFIQLLDCSKDLVAGRVFNAVGFNKSVNQIAVEIQQVLGDKVQLNRFPPRDGEHSFILNQDKLAQVTGLIPRGTLFQAIHELEANLIL